MTRCGRSTSDSHSTRLPNGSIASVALSDSNTFWLEMDMTSTENNEALVLRRSWLRRVGIESHKTTFALIWRLLFQLGPIIPGQTMQFCLLVDKHLRATHASGPVLRSASHLLQCSRFQRVQSRTVHVEFLRGYLSRQFGTSPTTAILPVMSPVCHLFTLT